jgi:hypothetical protein
MELGNCVLCFVLRCEKSAQSRIFPTYSIIGFWGFWGCADVGGGAQHVCYVSEKEAAAAEAFAYSGSESHRHLRPEMFDSK